jgi:hypothetical protein
VRYLDAPVWGSLAGAAIAAVLAPFARSTWLVGSVALLALLAAHALIGARDGASPASPERRVAWRRHAAVALMLAAGLVAASLGLGRLRFGEWSLGPPLDRHIQFRADPPRLAKIGGRSFHLANLRTGVVNYMTPGGVRFVADFPWIAPVSDVWSFPETRIDGHEHFVSLPHALGALGLLSVLGARARGRRPRWLWLTTSALALAPATLFLFVGYCGRYLFDFYPALALGAGLGLGALSGARRARLAAIAVTGVALYNLAVCAALAVAMQRVFSPPLRLEEIARLSARVDAFTGAARAR